MDDVVEVVILIKQNFNAKKTKLASYIYAKSRGLIFNFGSLIDTKFNLDFVNLHTCTSISKGVDENLRELSTCRYNFQMEENDFTMALGLSCVLIT